MKSKAEKNNSRGLSGERYQGQTKEGYQDKANTGVNSLVHTYTTVAVS